MKEKEKNKNLISTSISMQIPTLAIGTWHPAVPMPAPQSKLAHRMFARAHKNMWRDIPRLGAPTMAPAATCLLELRWERASKSGPATVLVDVTLFDFGQSSRRLHHDARKTIRDTGTSMLR